MNLFLNPSEKELHSLLSETNESPIHDVVVDYDGEVLIDPQLNQPELDLKKFKFHTRLTEFSRRALSGGSKQLKYLMQSLLSAWERDNYSTVSLT